MIENSSDEANKGEEIKQNMIEPKKIKKEAYYNYFIGFLSAILVMITFNNINKIIISYDADEVQSGKVQNKLNLIDKYLKEYYVDNVNNEKVEEGIYKGMLYGVGDPYTSYFTKNEIDKFTEQMSGQYAGIGVVVETDPETRLLTITTVFEGAPGAKAGLLIGDKIIKVNEEDITLMPVESVIQRIKGKAGTKLMLSVLRETESLDIELVRKLVEIPTVKYRVLKDNMGYIQIVSFDQITISQFDEALKSLKEKNIKSLIIDVRNNPGGALETVISIADTILPKGLIMYTEEKSGQGRTYESDERSLNMPLAVLVNENSASASEVLAGAIKAHKVGILVGTKTFGKGVVQKIFPLSDGSALKITISKYFTPDKVCIQGIGIEPNYTVELPKEIKNKISLTDKEDVQLQKAIELLKTK
ncbi:MAG: hypothetical protein A2Y18_06105 [Clostridiales bacterium GWD2_32_19]|nr:MAG: hypothetical protein A2Y18_06105 [Clostridiales bacterium GWD2_32_19]